MRVGATDLEVYRATASDLSTIDIGSHSDARFADGPGLRPGHRLDLLLCWQPYPWDRYILPRIPPGPFLVTRSIDQFGCHLGSDWCGTEQESPRGKSRRSDASNIHRGSMEILNVRIP